MSKRDDTAHRGEVATYHKMNQAGTISVPGLAKPVEFTWQVWHAPKAEEPEKGDLVEVVLDDRGRKAKTVRFALRPKKVDDTDRTDPKLPESPTRPHVYTEAAEAFLNPYNFVRPLATPVSRHASEPDVVLLGRCPPPPHDRYVGFTGRLHCTVTTRGPVFVSDSQCVGKGEGKEHYTYQFFRTFTDGADKPAIPGSSLRGMVRSVFEAVTNSCWEHVHDSRLGRRLNADEAKRFVPARLRFRRGRPEVVLLTGEHPKPLPNGPPPLKAQYAAWVPFEADHPNGRPAAVISPLVKHGRGCFARMEGALRTKPGRCSYHSVLQLGTKAEVRANLQPGEMIRKGYYCDNWPTVDNKHDERFFYREGRPLVVKLGSGVLPLYRELLGSYKEFYSRQKKDPKSKAAPPSRFVLDELPKTDASFHGHLVYAWVEDSGKGLEVRAISPVAVPRLLYRATLRERFPKFVATRPCSTENRGRNGAAAELCPACRTFGWTMADAPKSVRHTLSTGAAEPAVADQASRSREAERGAYRSRVRFGDAVFREEDLDRTGHTLPPLSGPKPTTVRFYLMREDRDLKTRSNDEAPIDYDSKQMVLRGRKFYRRHKTSMMDHAEQNNQNRTIREHLPAGPSASFTVDFQNLASVELGALLWSLELDGAEWQHRVGLGKPLGMGAVSIRVHGFEWLPPDRYGSGADVMRSISSDPSQTDERLPLVDELKDSFRTAMAHRYAAESFAELENVRDLAEMLSAKPRLPVEYPWLKISSRKEDEGGHIWFGVNRRVKKNHGDRGEAHWLDLADGDGGLPRDPVFRPSGAG